MRSLITTAIKTAFSIVEDMQDSVTLIKRVKTVDPADGSITETTVSTVVTALVLPIDQGAVMSSWARGEVRAENALGMKRFLIEAARMEGVGPDYYDEIEHNSNAYFIVSYVTDLANAMWTIVAKIQR